jgi:hypothetical protein
MVDCWNGEKIRRDRRLHSVIPLFQYSVCVRAFDSGDHSVPSSTSKPNRPAFLRGKANVVQC